jgi:hypothetical protein
LKSYRKKCSSKLFALSSSILDEGEDLMKKKNSQSKYQTAINVIPVRFVRRTEVVPKLSKLDGEFIDSIKKYREIDLEENTMEAIISSFQDISLKEGLVALKSASFKRESSTLVIS